MPANTTLQFTKNPVILAGVLTAALSAVVLAGVSLDAGGAAQDLLRNAGFGRNSSFMAEQRQQAEMLKQMELTMTRTRSDIALLTARMDKAENLPDGAAPGSASDASGRTGGAGALRAALTEESERNRNEFRAVNKRLDGLEKTVAGQPGAAPATGTAVHRQSSQLAHGWHVLHAENGTAVIAGKDGGNVDVTPGIKLPDLGRVTAIRQERGRWVVVTDNGTTIR